MVAPEQLLQRLEQLGAVLSGRGDAIALIGQGSVGADTHRLDEHSDLDFFVVVEREAKPRYIGSIDWLEALYPVAYSFANTVDGRKVLFEDGVFAEYAVFTLEELARASFSPGRVVWQRADAPPGLESPPSGGPSLSGTPGHQLNEALTNLYVGLHRDARGEHLSGVRYIQGHAIDRIITMMHLLSGSTPQDAFDVARGAESRFDAEDIPFADFVLGYRRNPEAALNILAWLEAHGEVSPVMAAAIRSLAGRQPAG